MFRILEESYMNLNESAIARVEKDKNIHDVSDEDVAEDRGVDYRLKPNNPKFIEKLTSNPSSAKSVPTTSYIRVSRSDTSTTVPLASPRQMCFRSPVLPSIGDIPPPAPSHVALQIPVNFGELSENRGELGPESRGDSDNKKSFGQLSNARLQSHQSSVFKLTIRESRSILNTDSLTTPGTVAKRTNPLNSGTTGRRTFFESTPKISWNIASSRHHLVEGLTPVNYQQSEVRGLETIVDHNEILLKNPDYQQHLRQVEANAAIAEKQQPVPRYKTGGALLAIQHA